MDTKLSKFEKVFVDIVKVYTKFYDDHSFKLFFDDFEYPQIGSSKKVVNVKILDSSDTFKRIFAEGSVGLGEVYCEGKIDVLDSEYKYFLMIFVRITSNFKMLFNLPLSDIYYILKARLKNPFYKRKNQDENINSHYSLNDWFENDEDSNQFYLYWLGSKYIQYSCGKWDRETKTLEEAQINKFEFYAKRLGIDKNSKGKKLLDLGCGWGGFIFYFAEKYGLNCTGLSLSTAQITYMKSEIKKRELGSRVSVERKNIHDMSGEWDYIISVGVLEHIDNYDDLYKKSAKHLKENGRALFHSMFHRSKIYVPDPFLLKYIFPGGGTPHMKSNIFIFKKYFKNVSRNDLPALSYPKTLQCWFKNFCKNEDKIRKLLKEKSSCKDIDFAVRIFKHYLVLAQCGLTDNGLVSNILVYN